MNTIVKITVKENGDVKRQYLSNFDLSDNQTSTDVKSILSKEYNISESLEIQSETLSFRNEELKNEDIVPLKPGLKYQLNLVKKNDKPRQIKKPFFIFYLIYL